MITDDDIPNPWKRLPKVAPFVLPQDIADLEAAGQRASSLRLDTLPDPYLGDPDSSRVLFLLLNPGFRPSDVDLNMKSRLYIRQSRKNLKHKAKPSFYFFRKGLEFSGGYIWWSRVFKPLIRAGITHEQLGKRVMCIEYFPYHSKNYTHLSRQLPSQAYSFHLVKNAIKDGKIIVMMRSERIWLKAVPELADYPYIKVVNPQNPVISVANLGQANFDLIQRELSR